jgi:hypothetical protein
MGGNLRELDAATTESGTHYFVVRHGKTTLQAKATQIVHFRFLNQVLQTRSKHTTGRAYSYTSLRRKRVILY